MPPRATKPAKRSRCLLGADSSVPSQSSTGLIRAFVRNGLFQNQGINLSPAGAGAMGLCCALFVMQHATLVVRHATCNVRGASSSCSMHVRIGAICACFVHLQCTHEFSCTCDENEIQKRGVKWHHMRPTPHQPKPLHVQGTVVVKITVTISGPESFAIFT